MENDLDKDEFELFLKQKADQHKLYPSDNAWNGIFNSLHPGMKWFKVGGSLLILGTLFFVYQQTSFLNSSNSSLTQSNLSTDKKFIQSSSASPSSVSSGAASSKAPSSSNLLPGSIGVNNSTTYPGVSKASNLNNSIKGSNSIQTPGISSPFELSGAPGSPVGVTSAFTKSTGLRSNDPEPENSAAAGNVSASLLSTATDVLKVASTRQLKGFVLSSNPFYWQHLPVMVGIPSKHVSVTNQDKNTGEADLSLTRELKTSEIKVTTLSAREDINLKDINWLQEMAAIKLTTHKKNPFNIQFYFSPTVSFRRLADNQNSSHTGIFSPPVSTRDLNINNYVNHSSAVGAELGSNILFSAGRNLTLKTGLQLNYTRYNIKAYRYTNEKTSIVLNSSAGSAPDTLSSYTSIRNFTGYAPEQLENQYLQLSMPIGAELKIIGNKKLQFSVAGSIQPTILLYSDTYLLSTNYLNYTKEPSLVRKWNVNSAFEAFLSYKMGALRWQLGPQFRYQLMSSYNDRYPIKEYLFEYGVKIGVSKTIR